LKPEKQIYRNNSHKIYGADFPTHHVISGLESLLYNHVVEKPAY
jgi:hypothetical protein